MIIGIDPGVTGAIAFFHSEPELTLESVHDLPTMQRGKTGNKQQINGAALAELIRAKVRPDPLKSFVYLELVKGMPRIKGGGSSMGATSAFNFGHTFGVIEGVLQGVGIPYVLVPPESWKKRAKLVGAEKDASRTRAIQMWPAFSELLKRKKDVGRAEAMLILYYGSMGANA